jgi:16S rRNA (cytosine1402-N4)-methyltransferase
MRGADESPHTPVLAQEVLNALLPSRGGRYVDGTVGAGGHAAQILEASSPDGTLLGLDSDPEALATARVTLEKFGSRVILVSGNFGRLESIASALGFVPAQGVLLDLGLSSMQLSNPSRGFSFTSESLDMRMDPTQETTAQDLVNELDKEALAGLIFRYGEERLSRQITRRIVEARPILSARQLASVIERAVGRHGRTHPATRTFQALRIAVNHELEVLEAVLPQLTRVTAPGSRVAIITFHSLEDRLVKNFIKGNRDWQNLTKHPIKPTRAEILANPRARSAKLRVAERVQP